MFSPVAAFCLCVPPDRCLPAHAALCAGDAAAGPARHRRRGPAAQAGAPQAHGQVCRPLRAVSCSSSSSSDLFFHTEYFHKSPLEKHRCELQKVNDGRIPFSF